MTSEEVFRRFVPEAAVAYCNKLYQKLNFEFKVKKARSTKFGDYRIHFDSGKQTITINNDLNPYAFLVTYLHEVAHLIAFNQYGRTIQPHGKEWKQCFRDVSKPMLLESIFPPPVLNALVKYLKNPKASSCSDPALYQVLRQFDSQETKLLLQDIPVGQLFVFNGKQFIKLEKKRTRSVCKEVKTKRKYSISELADVQLIA